MSAKLEVGQWVRQDERLGSVREYRDGHHVRVQFVVQPRIQVCDDRKLEICMPPRALVLEGSLDPDLHSLRSEEAVLRTWLRTHNVLLAYKNIHLREDIDVIGKAIERKKTAFVHISCHGGFYPPEDIERRQEEKDTERRPYITLAPKAKKKDRIFLDDEKTIQVFARNFKGLPILFSACLVGRRQDPITKFCKLAGLSQVAAFTREVYDCEAILFELLVYHAILEKRWSFTKAIRGANKALRAIGVKGGIGQGQALARVFP